MKFIRTYLIEPELDEVIHGYKLYCFEDDDCIWEKFFRNREDAVDYGDRFVDGEFVDGFTL